MSHPIEATSRMFLGGLLVTSGFAPGVRRHRPAQSTANPPAQETDWPAGTWRPGGHVDL